MGEVVAMSLPTVSSARFNSASIAGWRSSRLVEVGASYCSLPLSGQGLVVKTLREWRRSKVSREGAVAFWSRGADNEEAQRGDKEGFLGPLTSIADFTRFRDKGEDGAELQTAIISYRKPFPWSLLRPSLQVDLVAAVHIADKEYFTALQEELEVYDRVLYEMVADKNPKQKNSNAKYRWRPPKRDQGGRGQGFSIIGTIQRIMAYVLTLDFQLECMDYRQDNWYHADLDYETFQVLQVGRPCTSATINEPSTISSKVLELLKAFTMCRYFLRERGETFFTFARDLTAISSKTIARNVFTMPDLDPWRSKLFWVSRVLPMPLLGLLVIQSVCSPSDFPLSKSPEMKALLELDFASAVKVFLARQITQDLTDGASALVENSVIIGERNRVAIDELQDALKEGCNKIAIFYGSGHLPDMDARLRNQFGLEPTELRWQTAWSIKRRNLVGKGGASAFLRALAEVSGWPLNRYQTVSLLLLSSVMAIDLWFWELILSALHEYAQQTLLMVGNVLDRGWTL